MMNAGQLFRLGFLLILFVLLILWWTKWGLSVPGPGDPVLRLPDALRKRLDSTKVRHEYSVSGLRIFMGFIWILVLFGLYIIDRDQFPFHSVREFGMTYIGVAVLIWAVVEILRRLWK